MRPLAVALAVALASSAGLARADSPPGAPHPSRGAPGDRPGNVDPFGTQGSKALRSRTPDERAAAVVPEVIERVQIVGADGATSALVRDHVLPLGEGDVVTSEGVLESRARLVQLGAFSDVDVHTEPGSAPGRVVLRVAVQQRTPITVADLTVAQTPVSRPYGGLTLATPNLFGVGLGASLSGAADGHGRLGLSSTLYQPDLRLGGSSWVAGLRALYEEGRESGCATARCGGSFGSIPWVRYRRTGGELDLGLRPGAFSRFLLGYRLEWLRATSDPGVVPTARPSIVEGRSLDSAIVVSFDLDSRTDAFLPSHGSRVQATATIGTAALGSDYEYSRFLLQGERWFPLRGGHALRADAAIGLVQGDAPFFQRFYAADWSYFSIGLAAPRLLELNFSPDARYDVLLAVLGGEWNVPLWTDAGRLFRKGFVAIGLRVVYTAATPSAARSLLSQVPVSFDLGVRVDTRYGVFGIGLGYVTDQILKAVPLHVPGVNVQTR